MILLSKKENELTKDEELKVEIMKTLAMAKGYDFKDDKLDLDFRDGSGFEKAARFLVAKFDIVQKKKKENKVVIKEKEKTTKKSDKK